MKINKEKYIIMDGNHPLYRNNKCFDSSIAHTGPGHSFLVKLFQSLENTDIGIITSDVFFKNKDKIKKAVCLTDQFTKNTLLLKRHGVKLSVNISFESPIIARKYYHKLKKYSGRFNHSFNYNGTFERLKNTKTNFHNIYWPVNTNARLDLVKWDERESIIMIASNKRSVVVDFSNFKNSVITIKNILVNLMLKLIDPWMRIREIYSDRIEAIKYYSDLNKLDLYGIGWEQPISGYSKFYSNSAIKSYRGPVSYEDKIPLLNKYKFAICFENCPFPGYISEKIFDCLLAGCIPIYYGAPDISSHIPYNCYIDFRDFMSFSELNKYLDSIDESLANKYLDQALLFLNSNEFKKFDEDFFVIKLIEIFKIELNK